MDKELGCRLLCRGHLGDVHRFAGKLATLLPIEGEPNDSIFGIEISTLSDFFLVFAIMAGVASLFLALITPWLKRMIGEGKHNI